jgi:hypothetical protein
MAPHGKVFTVAVASDLHAFTDSKDAAAPSYLNINGKPNSSGLHPLSALTRMILDLGLVADLLLCPGDLGDKASQEGTIYAWDAIHKIAKSLKSITVLATTGNHDVDSRFIHDVDPLSTLKSLVPTYPTGTVILDDRYFARAYVIYELNGCRVLVLNSCAYHGGQTGSNDHGHITPTTVQQIKTELKELTPKRINILLCHHHPQQHTELGLGDYDIMKNGQLLLDLVGSGEFGHWMVIHGHKHHPKLNYAAGGSESAIVFSAASLSASLYPELHSAARNQFHLVQFNLDDPLRKRLVGSVRSWSWHAGTGWEPAGAGPGMPTITGFGCRSDLSQLAAQINSKLTGPGVTSWADFLVSFPEAANLVPADFSSLRRYLASDGIEIFEVDGIPDHVGRKISEKDL